MSFAESYLAGGSEFPDLGSGKQCGDHHCQLNFVGGPYLFAGMANEQAASAHERYKGSCDANCSLQHSVITEINFLDRKLFKEVSFIGKKYVFDREYHEAHTLLAGKNFLAQIAIQQETRGKLWLANGVGMGFLQVFENYFRILVAYRVLRLGGVVLHSGCAIVDDRAYLVLGRSGAGKSTFSRLALEAGCEILSDDLNAIFPDADGGWRVERLPFAGDLGQTPVRGGSYPLGGIYGLRQSDSNNVHNLTKAQAMALAISCSPVVNDDPFRSNLLFETLSSVVTSIDCGVIEFGLDGGVLSMLENMQHGNKCSRENHEN